MSKKMIIILSIVVAIVILGAIACLSFANHRGGRCNKGYHNRGKHNRGSYEMSERNYDSGYGHRGYNNNNKMYYDDMTVEEQTQYDALYEKFVPQMNALRDKIIDQRNMIDSERSKTTPDIAKINNAIDESSKFDAEMSKLRVEYSIEMEKLFPRDRNY